MKWLRRLINPELPGIGTLWLTRRATEPPRPRYVVIAADSHGVWYRLVGRVEVGRGADTTFVPTPVVDCSVREFNRRFVAAPDEEPSWTSPL